MVKDRDMELLWDTVSLLEKEKQSKRSKALLKLIVERTFSLLKQPTDVLKDIDMDMVPTSLLQSLQHLDQQIRANIKANNHEEASRLFVDYVGLLAQTVQKDKQQMQREILARLLSAHRKEEMIREQASIYVERKMETYTTSEVAQIINVSDQTIRRWCEKGKYPDAFQTDGGHWRIPKKYFRVDITHAQKRNAFLKKLDEKNRQAGEVDEFGLI